MTPHWCPHPSIYRRLPGFGHPVTEHFAIDLHFATPFRLVPELPAGSALKVWEKQDPAVREVFRNRARRLIGGDLSVVPSVIPPGYAAWLG